jgi:SAM-dependent methyltransferase
MPLRVTRPQLFPDDTNPLPAAGSAEQAALLDDELEIGNEGYLERLRQLSDVTDNIYPELLAAIRNTVAQALPGQRLRVLDLCSGVGVVSLQMIEADLPIDHLTLADLSPELMRRAQDILEKRLGAARMPPHATVQLDLLVDDLRQRGGAPYDLVVTCNAFQHFPRERQQELFRQIHDVLGPSGVFVFESHFKPVRPHWKQHLVDEYQAKLRRSGAPEQFVQDAADHVNNFHNYVNLREAYEWLEAAEFGFYECVFRKDEVGILVAVK